MRKYRLNNRWRRKLIAHGRNWLDEWVRAVGLTKHSVTLRGFLDTLGALGGALGSKQCQQLCMQVVGATKCCSSYEYWLQSHLNAGNWISQQALWARNGNGSGSVCVCTYVCVMILPIRRAESALLTVGHTLQQTHRQLQSFQLGVAATPELHNSQLKCEMWNVWSVCVCVCLCVSKMAI